MKKAILCILFGGLPACLDAQNRYDIVIAEIMADPTPVVGLPGNEWIELKNTSASALNLQNWRIADATSQSGPMPSFVLQPDSFVIVCTGSAVAAMSLFGPVISVSSFPSLDNDGEIISLKAANGKSIHAVNYHPAWYQNEVKREGGWTLEIVDPKNPCTGSSNWIASNHPLGGTPGKKNTADAINTDHVLPNLERAYTTDSVTVVLVFDEPVDSMIAANVSNYAINNGLVITQVSVLPPLFNLVQLKFQPALSPSIVYTLTAHSVRDCQGNQIENGRSVKLGLAVDPQPGDWVINEVLFDPSPNGYDFVELLNASEKVFDASRLYIASRNSNGTLTSARLLSATPFTIFPGDHIVATENPASLALQYFVKDPTLILAVPSMPSYPDDEGTVIILNFLGNAVDELHYKDDWHFKLLRDGEGVSLERIDPTAPTQSETNWHSAASTAGYATPTLRNSQSRLPGDIPASMRLIPEIFSPDNDGRDDFTLVGYEISDPGYVANVCIYEAAGRPVRYLAKNSTMAFRGYWKWDGLDDRGQPLPVGIYILRMEIFNLQGKRKLFRNTVVLARALK